MAKLQLQQMIDEITAEIYGPEPAPDKKPVTLGEKLISSLLGGRLLKDVERLINDPLCPSEILDLVDPCHFPKLPPQLRVRLAYGLPFTPVFSYEERGSVVIINPEWEEWHNWDSELGDITEYFPANCCPIKYIHVKPSEVYTKELRKALKEFPPQDWQKIVEIAASQGYITKEGEIYLENWDCIKNM